MSAYGIRSQLASVAYERREIGRSGHPLTLGRSRRTFEPSAPKVRTGEDECSGKCGIQAGMFLGRLSMGKSEVGSRRLEAQKRDPADALEPPVDRSSSPDFRLPPSAFWLPSSAFRLPPSA